MNSPRTLKPQWARLACLRKGVVFAPAAIMGNEIKAIFIATWDGDVPIIFNKKHAYLPVDWMARKCPDMADVCEMIDRKLRQAAGEKPE